jgi:hypothetical protein
MSDVLDSDADFGGPAHRIQGAAGDTVNRPACSRRSEIEVP